MFCAKCGKELNEGSEFCSGCGTKVGSSNESPNTSGQSNQSATVVTQVVAVPSGTAPLVMGLLGLFGGFIPVVQYITGLLSLLAIFVGISQKKKLKEVGMPTGKATAGIVLGLIAVVTTVVAIILSAALIGSLFSGVSSSNTNTTRINSITNALPTEMHGKVFTNGETTLEFGKNKVKLNDKWYRAKKILKDDRYKSVYSIYFSDRYVLLQNMRPIRLSYENEYIINDVAGFMTPQELEADTIMKENLAKEIVGIWEGTFSFENSVFGATSDMTLDISYKDREFTTILNFEVKRSYSSFAPSLIPVNSKGKCFMNMNYSNGNYELAFDRWMIKHDNFDGIEFIGELNNNVLSGKFQYLYGFGKQMGNFRVIKKS